jgi:DNA-binding transcriptional regulator LsrR (DeoR family)
VVASVAEASDTPVVQMRGGSGPGKANNRENGIARGAEQIDRDYFYRVCLLPAPIAEPEF